MTSRRDRDPFYVGRLDVVPLPVFLIQNPNYLKRKRFALFESKGYACVKCGAQAAAVVRYLDNGGHLHTDVMAVREGDEVMLTMDHIQPRSKGGSNKLSNLQPMCAPCNLAKADNIE